MVVRLCQLQRHISWRRRLRCPRGVPRPLSRLCVDRPLIAESREVVPDLLEVLQLIASGTRRVAEDGGCKVILLRQCESELDELGAAVVRVAT